IAMAGSLEFSKFILVGGLYRYWGHIHRPLKTYLCFAIFTLMLISSAGIYGYLSNAYHIAAAGVHTRMLAIEALQAENDRVLKQVAEFRQFIDNIPPYRISKKFEFQNTYQPKIAQFHAKSE